MVGTYLTQFEFVERLGKGALGVVYLVRRKRDGREFALKLLRRDAELDQDRTRLFLREAELAATLEHPGIAEVYEWGQDAGRHYILMEYVSGGPLRYLIDDDVISPIESIEIAIRVCMALAYAHRQGVVHQDINPSNILLTAEGKPKLVDFGMARKIRRIRRTRIEAMGTPAYMSPEQVRGKTTDHRTDIYSLGAVIFEMLCGRPPFIGESVMEVIHAVARREPPLPTDINATLPRRLENILLKAMRKNPRKRYADATAFSSDLKKFVSGKEISASDGERWHRTFREFKRTPWFFLTAVVALFFLPMAFIAARNFHRATQAGFDAETLRRARVETGELLEKIGLWRQAAQAYHDGGDEKTERELRLREAALWIADASAALEVGDLDGAEETALMAKDLVRADPPPALVKLLDRVARLRSDQARRREALERGRTLETLGRLGDALDEYRKGRWTGSTPLMEAISKTYENVLRKEAIEKIKEILVDAERAWELGDLSACLSHSEEVLELTRDLDPSKPWPEDVQKIVDRAFYFYTRATARRRQGRFDRLMSDGEALVARARKEGATQTWREALRAFEEAALLLPEAASAREAAAACRTEITYLDVSTDAREAVSQARWDSAETLWKKARSIKPGSAEARRALSELADVAPVLPKALEIAGTVTRAGGKRDPFGNPVVRRNGLWRDPETRWPYELVESQTGLRLVFVAPGWCHIGSEGAMGRTHPEETPRRSVKFDRPVFLGKYEVTQGQWAKVTGKAPPRFQSDRHPVWGVSWDDALGFIDALNLQCGFSGETGSVRFRLPSEGEWEYACRAGGDEATGKGGQFEDLDGMAWFGANSGDRARPAGGKFPNPWGLYDVLGNVAEWCADAWYADYRGLSNTGKARRSASSRLRVRRGGSWRSDIGSCRCRARDKADRAETGGPTGFRVVLEIP